MDTTKRRFYSAIFEAEFEKRNGGEFEELFSDIMCNNHPGDFVPTISWGSEGDWKCDGYLSSQKRLYAAYAPREMKKSKSISKIESDFYGAIDKWDDKIGEWVLVHNERDGLPSFILDKITDFENETEISIDKMGYNELKNKLLELSEDEIVDVLNLNSKAPTDTTEVRFEEIQRVIDTISGTDPEQPRDPDTVDPQKIESNQLSDDVEHLLRVGRKKSYQVHKFFSNYYDPSYGDRIAQRISQRYEYLRDEGLSPDTIFHRLHEFVGGGTRGAPEYEMAVLAVLSYFFEQCEIFEPA